MCVGLSYVTYICKVCFILLLTRELDPMLVPTVYIVYSLCSISVQQDMRTAMMTNHVYSYFWYHVMTYKSQRVLFIFFPALVLLHLHSYASCNAFLNQHTFLLWSLKDSSIFWWVTEGCKESWTESSVGLGICRCMNKIHGSVCKWLKV